MEFRYTRQQTARGSRPDAKVGDTWYLLKNVSRLRLTYQIRLLTFAAMEARARLVVRVPKMCRLSSHLREFVKENKKILTIERVS